MGSPQYPPDVGVHHTVVCAKEQDGMDDGQIEAAQRPFMCALLTQYPGQVVPAPSLSLDFSNDFHTFIVRRGKEPPEVPEGFHHL